MLSFVFRFIYVLVFLGKKREIYIKTSNYGVLFIRTHSSDLEVFFQHFIYHELIQKEITSLPNINNSLDLGANVGFASVILSQLFPDARIIAVELEEHNYLLLKKNCEKLIAQGRVKVVLGAFFPQNGANLQIVPGRLGDWNFSIRENDQDLSEIESPLNIFTMEVVEMMLDGERLDLIKMDIEGGEVAFLENDLWCEKVLQNSNLILELHTFKAYNLYFLQLRKNKIKNANRVGEYWMTGIQK